MPTSTRAAKKAKFSSPIKLTKDVQEDVADTKAELAKHMWAGNKENGTRVSILWHESGSKKNEDDFIEKWFDGTITSYDGFQYWIDLDPYMRDGKLKSTSDKYTLKRLNEWVEDNAFIILKRAPAALAAASSE